MNPDAEGYDQVEPGSVLTGASVSVQGTIVASQGTKQKVELKVHKIILVGKCDSSYPIQKKRVSQEFLRTKAHLRPRTNSFGAVMWLELGILWRMLHTSSFKKVDLSGWQALLSLRPIVKALENSSVSPLSSPAPMRPQILLIDAIPKTKGGLVDWSQDFFGKPAFLTVSGQLNGETYATALSDVLICMTLLIYTFGPTFRAENSNTSRHLAEFWMIEPELAFADLDDDMACATAYLQYVVKYVLDNCKEDMEFFDTWIEKGITHRLSVKWGLDLQSEHERYITE
ncbi:unnamed protein product [Brassica oleracea var. botrytis]